MASSYDTFLGTADLPTWAQCLREGERELERRPRRDDTDAAALVQVLCISMYTQWLGSLSGQASLREEAKAVYGRLVDTLRELYRRAPSAPARRGWGIVLAWRGYREAGKALLLDTGALGPELLLLVIPVADAEQAVSLRPHVSDVAGRPFPPAVYFYCNALIGLGAIDEAVRVARDAGLRDDDPLACDLLGKTLERAGRWPEAAQVYARSSWPQHKYRAAMCRVIARGGRPQGDTGQGAVVDEAMQAVLSGFEGEIDQVEVARCASFVNACLWNDYDDWLIRLELGKLNFRRRRYAEADAHLRKAHDLAPASARLAIADLRFSNLTWLTGRSIGADLPMEPEALEAAHIVVRAGAEAPRTASARIWTASVTRDSSLLPRDIEGWDPYDQAEAHRIVGNNPEALACALRSLTDNYQYRNVMALVSTFAAAGFESCVDHLVQRVMDESWYDFPALSELAWLVYGLGSKLGESSERFERLGDRLQRIEQRLLDLSEVNFQHLIRAHEYFAFANRQDRAEALLRRASQLAEGSAENLAVAVSRRRAEWFVAALGDPLGLDCLRRAERESRDRFERLQIARELFHYGRGQQARRIIEGEGVLGEGGSFTPIEYVVALQCGPWLATAELTSLARRAARALSDAISTGSIERYADRFRERLELVLGGRRSNPLNQGSDAADDEPVPPSAPSGLAKGEWVLWRDRMQRAVAGDSMDDEQPAFVDGLVRFGQAATLEHRLAHVAWLLEDLEQAVKAATEVRPPRAPGLIPICHNVTLDDDPRAVDVSDRWRAYLASTDPQQRDQAMAALRAFSATESELLAQWEAARRAGSERPWRRARRYAEWLARALPVLLTPRERGEPDPLLSQLYQCMASDAEALAGRVASRATAPGTGPTDDPLTPPAADA